MKNLLGTVALTTAISLSGAANAFEIVSALTHHLISQAGFLSEH